MHGFWVLGFARAAGLNFFFNLLYPMNCNKWSIDVEFQDRKTKIYSATKACSGELATERASHLIESLIATNEGIWYVVLLYWRTELYMLAQEGLGGYCWIIGVRLVLHQVPHGK
ncbi:hypothetical protein EYC84_010906 [Monilinia fructicola]|uniref:Uncharacterized protein n=1 Tax=Monilinia fructicola TaxID=38448 RepID=A0A5M9JD65_MONFR|nr:hypothetical protein EYC84_010906 [Monilinia fructicola]